MIGPDSRYATCVLFVDGSQEFIGTRQKIDTSPQPDDIFHTVVEGDRVDLIAYRYLGRAEMWWIVCDYNDIFFPMQMEVGTVLRVPSAQHVQMTVLG